MGKVKSFHIAFNGDKSVFVAGEIITGNIILQLNESMKARALRIKFHGKAHVHWSEQRGSGKNRRRVHYNANEDYFHNVVSVHGKESGGMSENAESIPAGQNIFPFQFQLPAELPSSFEGRHGYIRYYAKATIDKPWKFDHNTKKAFTILDNVDLNQDPDARLPVTANDSKTLCCLCCASGPIQAEVHLDRAGYVPGEFIMVNANVENGSDTNMPGTKATLYQHVVYRARQGKTKTLSNSITALDGPGCGKRQTIQWNNERLQIPAIPPSLQKYCSIIVIRYSLQFMVVVPGGSINLRMEVPVKIGSVPLQGLTPFNIPPHAEPTAPPLPNQVQSSAPPSTIAPPPTYAQVYNGATDIKDTDDGDYMMGDSAFAPQYAYYDWNQSAFSYS